MKPADCPKLDNCFKIKTIMDKDLLDFQYAEAIRAVCTNCTEVNQVNKVNKKQKVRRIRTARSI